MIGHQDDLAGMLEIDRDATANIGLHLPHAPIGLLGMTNQHTWLQHVVQISHAGGSRRKGDKMTTGAELAALLGSRICHDLISPLGAIGNGVELMHMSGARLAPELALIADSIASAQARIRFLRVAVGIAGEGPSISAPEIAALLAGVYGTGRITVDWQATGDLPRNLVRRAFLAIMCLQDALPLGGQIAVQRQGRDWTATASGPRQRFDAPLWAWLAGAAPATALSAAQVQFGLLHADLTAGPGPAVIETAPDRLVIRYLDGDA